VRGIAGSGPLLMVAATFAFTTMVACARFARGEIDGISLVFWRGLISLPLLVVVGRGLRLRVDQGRWALLVRCLLGFLALTSYFIAAGSVDLLTLSLIMRLQPILVTLGAPWILGRQENVGPGAYVAALVGFAGCALIAAPQIQTGSAMIFVAFLTPVFSAGAHLALRHVAQTNRSTAIVTWFHFLLIPFALGGLGIEGAPLAVPSSTALLPVLGVGIAATAGQVLMTQAYRLERASTVASASYASVLFALAYDVLLFGTIPSWWALPGGMLIIGSSLWLIRVAPRKRALGVAN